MKRLPTDQEILEAIYQRYYPTFASFEKGNTDRATKIYVPVDLQSIASELGVDGDIIFGRLYYYLNQKYGYKNDDGSRVSLFELKLKDDLHCINFPLLASILASLQLDDLRNRHTRWVSYISLIIAISSLGISIYTNLWPKNEQRVSSLTTAQTTGARICLE